MTHDHDGTDYHRGSAVRVLSCHAAYRCRHAGACCSSNWPIPIEADRLARLTAALANGEVRPASGDRACDAPALLGRADGCCVFFDTAGRSSQGCCRIQAGLGHDALPLACRQFPRVSVSDPRGVSVTLSHYCPTAAGLLDADDLVALAIATGAPAFPDAGEYVGLDARDALPPLLRPDMLMDWDSWWACERLAVAVFDADDDPGRALARLRASVADLETWLPADGPLGDRVLAAFEAPRDRDRPAPASGPQLIDAVFASIPAAVRPPRFAPASRPSALATRRFLAAHAFANWTIHLGTGLRVWLRSIEAAAALLDAGAGVRHADLLLRHLSDPRELANQLTRWT